jgi:hypothetical protein
MSRLIFPLLVLFLSCFSTPGSGATNNKQVKIIVPDGQFMSGPLKIYVTEHLSLEENKPRLRLYMGHALLDPSEIEKEYIDPIAVVPDQPVLDEPAGDTKVTLTATLLLFSTERLDIPAYKPVARITPILSWTDTGTIPRHATVEHAVNLGNSITASIISIVVILVVCGAIFWIGRRKTGSSKSCLFCAPDGHLSLSHVQIGLWTVAVGGVLLFYGLTRINTPDVPVSVITLMGLSLVTGGLSYVAPTPPKTGSSSNPRKPELQDLICDFTDDGTAVLSISRAQMLFWTVILIGVFITQSALNGTLWDVPWPLVGLMGVSQAGYVAPKFAPSLVGKNPA